MRKAFNKNQNTVLEIKPIDEICDPKTMPLIPEGVPLIDKINYKHEEVFVNKKLTKNIELDINDDLESIIEEPIKEDHNVESITSEDPPKRKRGKRGKDKKPRAKRPPTEKQLAHLTRIRELSRQKREAKKMEKARLKKEIATKAEHNTAKNRIVKLPTTKPVPINPPPKKVKDNDYMQFFNLMDRYEEYKQERNEIKKLKKKPQPHPSNRVITQRDRPIRPTNNVGQVLKNTPAKIRNPYDVFFTY